MQGEGNTHDDWLKCPQGELTRMVGRLNASERRARARQLAGTGLLSLLIFAGATVLIGGFVVYQDPMFGGISCKDCMAHAADYHDHLLGEGSAMDVQLVSQIETHLKMCNCCRTKFQEIYADIPLERLTSTGLQFRLPQPLFVASLSPVGY